MQTFEAFKWFYLDVSSGPGLSLTAAAAYSHPIKATGCLFSFLHTYVEAAAAPGIILGTGTSFHFKWPHRAVQIWLSFRSVSYWYKIKAHVQKEVSPCRQRLFCLFHDVPFHHSGGSDEPSSLWGWHYRFSSHRPTLLRVMLPYTSVQVDHRALVLTFCRISCLP